MRYFQWLLTSILFYSCTIAAAPVGDEKIHVAILMFDGVEIIDFAAPYEAFGQAGFDVRTVSRDGKAVKTAMNLSVNVDDSFDSTRKADVVVVPGGNIKDAASDAPTLAWIVRNAKSARQILSVCTGSDILASTGLLDGQRATTFHKHFNRMASAFPKVTVVRNQRWVESGNIITSAGLTSGMDAALEVIANLKGKTAARSVALHLEYDWSQDPKFIRGVLADQFMRMPSPEIAFPEGTDFDEVTSVGDKQYWETEFRVTSPLASADLVALIRKHAKSDSALSVLPLPDRMQLAWQYEAERGGQWRMSLQAAEEQPERPFRLVLKVIRLD